jgi:hypothetical protein
VTLGASRHQRRRFASRVDPLLEESSTFLFRCVATQPVGRSRELPGRLESLRIAPQVAGPDIGRLPRAPTMC